MRAALVSSTTVELVLFWLKVCSRARAVTDRPASVPDRFSTDSSSVRQLASGGWGLCMVVSAGVTRWVYVECAPLASR